MRLPPLQARVRSGNLGGRPRKPTVEKARAQALERLTPKAIRVLEEQLDSGRADAWRPALRVLDHAWGRPPEHLLVPELPAPTTVAEIESMPTAQLLALVRGAGRSTGGPTGDPTGDGTDAQDDEQPLRP